MNAPYDLAVVGGGIMGCATALRASQGGMRTIVLDQAEIGGGASGVNTGTLSLQIKRVKLMPYALKGRQIWEDAGDAVGYCKTGGLTLAFTAHEAELLHERMTLRREAGAPIEMVSPNWAAEREPELGRKILAASFCAEDGHADPSVTGAYYRAQMRAHAVDYKEFVRVDRIDRNSAHFTINPAGAAIRAKRLLLACGGWLKRAGTMVGVELPVVARINTVSVTERAPPLLASVVGHATGLLTLKQKSNGTMLIGGGWQGTGDPDAGRGKVSADTLLTNLRLAQFALPKLGQMRIVRAWTGFEAHVPDFYPLAGPIASVPNAFVLGCVRGGYTIGPYIGRLMGDLILGHEPEMPLFDPERFGDPLRHAQLRGASA